MAFIMKRPQDSSPGIIIFTHKEWHFFKQENVSILADIARLRRSYLLGMHWGHYFGNVEPPPAIDFHMAGQGTLDFAPGHSARRLYFCSRNFVPDIFHPGTEQKDWDIILVARPLRLKNIDHFFQVLKQVMKKRPATRTLLICPGIPRTNSETIYTEIAEDYRHIFSEEERKNITFLLLSPELYPFPLSQDTMALFYQRSRIFTLFTKQEGESRVIAEALLCGLPVVVRRDLVGGGRDFLNEKNSFQFSILREAADGFLGLLNQKDEKCDIEPLARELRADYTVPRFRASLCELFSEMGHPFFGELDLQGLDRKLPGHTKLLPADMTSGATDDLPDNNAFALFAKYVCPPDKTMLSEDRPSGTIYNPPPLAMQVRLAFRNGCAFAKKAYRSLTRLFLRP